MDNPPIWQVDARQIGIVVVENVPSVSKDPRERQRWCSPSLQNMRRAKSVEYVMCFAEGTLVGVARERVASIPAVAIARARP